MALPHKSIATISSPQFINLQPLDINPLMSSCEIKVLYIGENRNRSYISKEVATQMAKTLRGAPIVGYYKESKEDFSDHGEQIIFDDEGIHFNVLTKPYGFVAPDAKVWFQKFNDSDDFGNTIEREYLMTTGYLWVGQFEEANQILKTGKPQSMELDENSLDGHWSTNIKNNIEFFIINDAVFTKLCILGDDVQPCFEGASITKPEISSTFSKTVDDNFKKTLFSMIQDLQDALKGGYVMGQEENKDETPVEEFAQEETLDTPAPEVDSSLETSENQANEEPESNFEQASSEDEPTIDNPESSEESSESTEAIEFAKDDEEDDKDEDQEKDTDEGEEDSDDPDEDDDKKKYSLLEQQYNDLTEKYNLLKNDYDTLVEFKNEVENQKKDALIDEFYMLSEEDKKDVIENKVKYTLEEIKAKLAVICYEKKVNFNSDNDDEIDNNIEQNEVTTFNFDGSEEDNLPDWVRAVKNVQNSI